MQIKKVFMQKTAYLLLLLLALPFCLRAEWRMDIHVINYSAGATDSLSNWASFGEMQSAQEGYDSQDLLYNIPPMGNRYVVPYFRHTDWGANSGNFSVDIRSTVPNTKIWESSVKAQSPYTSSYTLRWHCVWGEIPAYYSPKLILGQSQIDMRSQTSFTYVSGASITNFSIQLVYDPQMPYITQPIGNILFANNQPVQIVLNHHFAVNSGSLSYSFAPNEYITQTLLNEAGNRLWKLQPVEGWIGSTSLTITAHNGTKSICQTVSATRNYINSAPEFIQPLPHLEIMQNSFFSWHWGALAEDPDGDAITLEALPTSALDIIIDNVNKILIISPAESFKGNTQLQIYLSDGTNLSFPYLLEISVLPSTPQPVQNLQLSTTTEGMILTWNAVTLDIGGKAIGGIVYNVYSYAEPSFSAPQHLIATGLADTFLAIPAVQRQGFFRVIANNP